MKGLGRNQGLEIAVTRNRLVISIGLNTLRHAAEAAPGMCSVGDGGLLDENDRLPITNVLAFAKGVARELEHESEDGTTDVHRAIDAAVDRLIESGDECIIVPEDFE